MKSDAATVEAYVAGLPAERRAVVETMLALLRDAMPDGYEEAMSYGMATWHVPLARHPDTYNKQPLMFAALAAQKTHYAVYLRALDAVDGLQTRFTAECAAAGKTLDMGVGCVRFRRIEDLHLPAIAAAIRAVTPETFIASARAKQAAKNKR
jgi:uncharacterized protein YdhG (YjbR/CyaY superfamily)